MSHFEKIGDDTIKIDPISLGNLNRILNDAAFNIQEILDDYIYIINAKLELERLESEG